MDYDGWWHTAFVQPIDIPIQCVFLYLFLFVKCVYARNGNFFCLLHLYFWLACVLICLCVCPPQMVVTPSWCSHPQPQKTLSSPLMPTKATEPTHTRHTQSHTHSSNRQVTTAIAPIHNTNTHQQILDSISHSRPFTVWFTFILLFMWSEGRREETK